MPKLSRVTARFDGHTIFASVKRRGMQSEGPLALTITGDVSDYVRTLDPRKQGK